MKFSFLLENWRATERFHDEHRQSWHQQIGNDRKVKRERPLRLLVHGRMQQVPTPQLKNKHRVLYINCFRVTAADGGVYPPKSVQKKQLLHVLVPQVCRTLPLVYEGESNILDDKIPAYRYGLPDYVTYSAQERPENQCYCNMNSGDCPLKGVYNVTPCNFGT